MALVSHATDRNIDRDLQLPEGWVSARLGAIADSLTYGYTASARGGSDGPRFLRITDLQNGSVNWNEVPTCQITNTDVQKYGLRSGDIVFARTGATTGKSFLIRSCPPAVFASYLIRLRLLADINPALLGYFFQTRDYWSFVSDNVAGIAQPNCNATKLSELRVPVPPYAEQQRLIEAIGVSLSKVDAARDHLSRAPAILKRFRQAVLAAACSGRLTEDWRRRRERDELVEYLKLAIAARRRQAWDASGNQYRRHYPEPIPFDDLDLPEIPETWKWVSADEVCSQITDGEHIQPRYKHDGFPMITATHVRDGFVEFKDVGLISDEDFQKCLLRCSPTKDDILIVSVGATTGRAAIVQKCQPFAMVRSVLMLRPLIQSKFLLRWIQSPWCQRWISQASGASAQPHFYIHDNRRMPVPLAPVSEQLEIARRIDALFALADEIERRVSAATIRSDKLTQSILAKAFRGELVPTEAELSRRKGRDYEPASVLLERIKKERGEQTSRKPKQQRRRPKAELAAVKG